MHFAVEVQRAKIHIAMEQTQKSILKDDLPSWKIKNT
jgi:hypothetical protein